SDLRANFASDKGAILQEYWAYFKKLQRMDGAKFPQSAADAFVRCCPIMSRSILGQNPGGVNRKTRVIFCNRFLVD
ncbi:MAG: hypothetical protein MSK63_08995, partial [Clostridiales bacterium]|nr:hypothetical protein [Clostridiales bacterium]MDY3692326.1 hypothetical protein [Dysosmobacter sp.]